MATVWGEISGFITNQVDLNALIDVKSNGLNKVTEEVGKDGWILKDNNGRLLSNPVGAYSIDFTWQDQSNPVRVVGAIGNYSFATGRNTLASGFNSTVSGDSSVASGNNSIASGLNTTASGDYSYAAGRDNIAEGLQSFVVGVNNNAISNSSFAAGNTNIVEAHATNPFQTALNGFASGSNLIVNNPNQAAFGSYNALDESDNSGKYKIFTIGIGSSTPGIRQNGFEVYNGTGLERGSVKAPYLQQSTIEADITGKVLITKEYLESAYNHAFDDAPIDGKIYGRSNKSWKQVADGASTQVYYKGTVTPPQDFTIPNSPDFLFSAGDIYMQYQIPHFVTDGNVNDVDGNTALYDGNYAYDSEYREYMVKDTGSPRTGNVADFIWIEITNGTLNEAPSNNVNYNRRNDKWVEAAIQKDVLYNNKTYYRRNKEWVEADLNIVFKGVEEPNTLDDFGATGDNYMRQKIDTPPNNYVLNSEPGSPD